MKHKRTPLHNLWHRRVEGQIRNTIGQHPEWFKIPDKRTKETLVNSLAKRIVGEIVAATSVATVPDSHAEQCDDRDKRGLLFQNKPRRDGDALRLSSSLFTPGAQLKLSERVASYIAITTGVGYSEAQVVDGVIRSITIRDGGSGLWA